MLLNVCNYLPVDTAQHPPKPVSSAAPLEEPRIWHERSVTLHITLTGATNTDASPLLPQDD
jgi:hypothetical protein